MLYLQKIKNPIVLTVKSLNKANFQTILKLFNDSMSVLWPEKLLPDKVLLYITDTASYIIKPVQTLKMFYSKLLITYMAYGLHKVLEAIRDKFLKVYKFI